MCLGFLAAAEAVTVAFMAGIGRVTHPGGECTQKEDGGEQQAGHQALRAVEAPAHLVGHKEINGDHPAGGSRYEEGHWTHQLNQRQQDREHHQKRSTGAQHVVELPARCNGRENHTKRQRVLQAHGPAPRQPATVVRITMFVHKPT